MTFRNNNTRHKHYCHHCGKVWDEDYLADLCFKMDMDNLTKGKDHDKKDYTAARRSRNRKSDTRSV